MNEFPERVRCSKCGEDLVWHNDENGWDMIVYPCSNGCCTPPGETFGYSDDRG